MNLVMDKLSYSMDEVRQKTGLSLSTIKRMIAAEQLRKVNVGRRVLIPATEIDRLLGAAQA